MVGGLYRILTKLLASRLKRALRSLISPCQTTFVLGREMLDGVLFTNEIIDIATKNKKDYFLFKVNFEKTYDKVSWDFLRFMIKKMGFGYLWMQWMEACVFTNHMSILVNGSFILNFEIKRGLRHGDPFITLPFCVGYKRSH